MEGPTKLRTEPLLNRIITISGFLIVIKNP